MKVIEIKLTDKFPQLSIYGDAILTAYLPDNEPELSVQARPSMLIFPGGGYGYVSSREAEPIALKFVSIGFNAFWLKYSIAPDYCYPAQLLQAAACIKHIRDNAQEYNVITDQLAVIGFSAGGHLAASTTTLFNEPVVLSTLNAESNSLRPDAAILSYPVISGINHPHVGSFDNLARGDQKLVEYLSLENRVNSSTSPCFLWHTSEDDCVPPQNSLMFATALSNNKVPFELHIFPRGCHGLSLSDQTTSMGQAHVSNATVAQWFPLAAKWLEGRGFAIQHKV